MDGQRVVLQCRAAATLRMASEHCARAKARDGSAETACADPVASDAPAAALGGHLSQLAENVLESVQEREQKVWSLQLDARDLRGQIEATRSSESGAQARSLLVRPVSRAFVASASAILSLDNPCNLVPAGAFDGCASYV